MLALPLLLASLAVDPVGSCVGDLNGDRTVDGRDLTVMLSQFGEQRKCEPSAAALAIEDPEERAVVIDLECMQDRPRADINGDLRVDGLDLTALLSTFGCSEF